MAMDWVLLWRTNSVVKSMEQSACQSFARPRAERQRFLHSVASGRRHVPSQTGELGGAASALPPGSDEQSQSSCPSTSCFTHAPGAHTTLPSLSRTAEPRGAAAQYHCSSASLAQCAPADCCCAARAPGAAHTKHAVAASRICTNLRARCLRVIGTPRHVDPCTIQATGTRIAPGNHDSAAAG